MCYSNFHEDSQIPKLFAFKETNASVDPKSKVLACNPVPREYGQWAGDHSWFDEAGGKETDEFRGRGTMHLKNCIQCPAHESLVTVQSFRYAITTAWPLCHWRSFSLASSGMAKMFDRRPAGSDIYVDFVIRSYGKQQSSFIDLWPFYQKCQTSPSGASIISIQPEHYKLLLSTVHSLQPKSGM